MSRRILIVAGEASGDAHGGRLARALRAVEPTVELGGMGGALMQEAGVRTHVDSRTLSVMGFTEAASAVARVVRAYRRLVRELRGGRRPDVVVLIDFPDFNLRLAAAAHRAGVRVVYYVSPQVWAWRSGRVRKICRVVDRMLVLFPFEVDVYRRCGLDTHFVGHALAEDVRPTRTAEETRRRWGIPSGAPLVALLPGSRAKEVEHILPVMLAAARRLAGRATFAIAKAPGIDVELIREEMERSGTEIGTPYDAGGSAAGVYHSAPPSGGRVYDSAPPSGGRVYDSAPPSGGRVYIVENDTYNLVAASRAAAVASGTATVECAVLGCPMAVVYRMSSLSYALARRLVRVPFIAMPNIVLGERVVPELVQEAATPKALAAEIARYLDSDEACDRTSARLADVRRALVVPGAAERAARLVLETAA